MQALQQLAAANGGLVTTAAAAAVGIDRRRLADFARNGAASRVARGVYSVGSVLPDPRPIVTSLRGALSHQSAAAWWGVDLPRPPGAVHVTVPRNRGRRRDAIPRVRLHRNELRPHETTSCRGLLVTTPLRTAVDISRCDSLDDSVAVVDAFMRAGLVARRDFENDAAGTAGPGRRQLLAVSSMIDEKAGSVLESLARVLLWRNALAPTATQYWIRHDSWAARVDFAWPEQQAILETDGFEYHSSPESFVGDRRRWSALVRAGWRVGVVTWSDVTGDPAYVVGLVRDLLR